MAKHKYQVVKATQRPITGVNVDGKQMDFGKSGAFEVKDDGLAHDIEALEKTGDVVVVRREIAPEPGHPRSFLVPELPWKKK